MYKPGLAGSPTITALAEPAGLSTHLISFGTCTVIAATKGSSAATEPIPTKVTITSAASTQRRNTKELRITPSRLDWAHAQVFRVIRFGKEVNASFLSNVFRVPVSRARLWPSPGYNGISMRIALA